MRTCTGLDQTCENFSCYKYRIRTYVWFWPPWLHLKPLAWRCNVARVGQNHIYVYTRYFRQENHQIYGRIQRITVVANPKWCGTRHIKAAGVAENAHLCLTMEGELERNAHLQSKMTTNRKKCAPVLALTMESVVDELPFVLPPVRHQAYAPSFSFSTLRPDKLYKLYINLLNCTVPCIRPTSTQF